MKHQNQSLQFLRQRRFFMILPLLVLPFITMIFWALGGGNMENANAQLLAKRGFNMQLPNAYLRDDKRLDKMSYYEKASLDSIKMKELIKNDPNYESVAFQSSQKEKRLGFDTASLNGKYDTKGLNTSLNGGHSENDINEARVYRKLDELNSALKSPETETNRNRDHHTSQEQPSINATEVNRLENMRHTVNQPGNEDPEINQLNGMLEKIMDIQHPEKVAEKLKQHAKLQKGLVYPVSSSGSKNIISSFDGSNLLSNVRDSTPKSVRTTNGFYSLDEKSISAEDQNAISANLPQTQVMVSGSTVKLRLTTDININGVRIPKGQFVYGIAFLNGERLSIKINSIRFEQSLFPVELAVYDMDGMEGIYIPGAIGRDVKKQSGERALQGGDITTVNPTIGAQAASAGIETARSLLSKKVKLIKVTVKAGYHVLLMDEKQKNE